MALLPYVSNRSAPLDLAVGALDGRRLGQTYSLTHRARALEGLSVYPEAYASTRMTGARIR
jgi:hypothetical protein